MQTFFRDEMIVSDSDLTIPSHEKTHRLICALRQSADFHANDGFEPLPWECWSGTHDDDFVRLVSNVDPNTFDDAC